ncbi:MAG: hypothetical protein AAF597_15115, partial [Bacteroidota bacterium]
SNGDNCEIVQTIAPGIILDCADVAQTPRLFDDAIGVLDAAGNETRCSPTITVRDSLDPTIILGVEDTTVYLDAAGLATLEIEDNAAWAEDNCGVADVQIERVAVSGADAGAGNGPSSSAFRMPRTLTFTCDDLGNVNLEVEVEATDVNGNVTLDTITVTVLDTIAPVITCVSDTVYLDAMGQVSDAPGENVTIVEDNCPPMTIVGDPLRIFTCAEIGDNEFTETRTDESGNESEPCTFTVTVLDTISPELTCEDITLLLDENGEAEIDDVNDLVSGLSDNCTDSVDITLVLDAPVYGCDGTGGEATFSLGPVAGELPAWVSPTLGTDGPVGTCDCPPGYVVVGYEGNMGFIVDNMNLICAELLPDGSLGTDLVNTCMSGTSTGGTPTGDIITGPLVGAQARIGDAIDDFQGFGQTIAYIAAQGDNSVDPTEGDLLNDSGGGGMFGPDFAPPGHVVVGMNVWEPTIDGWARGLQLRFAPITVTAPATNTASVTATD